MRLLRNKMPQTSTIIAVGLVNISFMTHMPAYADSITTNTQTHSLPMPNTQIPVAYLDKLVVTATRSHKNLSDTPIPVTVIDARTLQDNHAHTLKDALTLLPNIYLAQLHGKTGYEVRMQGFSGDQVLVLIDGLPISASTGSTVNLNQYLNTNIEQIEVVQGAASAQYGSAAMGGVINVITQPIIDTHATMTAEVGSNGTQNPSNKSLDSNHRYVEASMSSVLSKDKRLRGRLSGSYLEEKGLSVDTTAWSLLKDPSEHSQLTAKLIYTPNPNSAHPTQSKQQYWLETGWYEETAVSRFDYYVPPKYLNQQRQEDIQRQRITVGGDTYINHQIDDTTQTYTLSGSVLYEDYNSASETQSNNVVTNARDTKMQTTLAQAQLDLPYINIDSDQSIAQSHALQIGIKGQHDALQQTKNQVSELVGEDVDRSVIEVYLQDDWLIGDNTEVVMGARYQEDSDFGDYFAPKIAVRQHYYDSSERRHTLRVSIGKGYRVPNLKERYYVFDHSNLGYKVMGNPALSPETSTSYQIGYQTNVNPMLSLSINGFYNDVNDLIQTDNSHPVYDGTIAIYSYDNINEASTVGGDAMINWQVTNTTAIALAYAHLQTQNKTTDSELTYSPQNKFTSRIEHQLTNQLHLIGQARYESEQLVNTSTQSYSPSWWVVDSRANYSATAHLNLYLAINNLLDEQRSANDANDQRPVDNRQWLVGASYHW